jgi:hypothetical protein
MIIGQTKTEALYRATLLDSSSSLKDFSQDRKKYYRKYVLRETVEEKDSDAITMGKVVETLLMEPELFDDKFYISACAKTPTDNMLNFVEALYKYTINCTDEEGNVTRSFEDISKDAFTESGYSGKGTGSYESVIKKFVGSDAEIYYNEIRKVRAKNLLVVSLDNIKNAEQVVEGLRNSPTTKDIVNLVNSSRWTVYNQLQVEGYVVDGHKFKSMMDKVVVDHEKKTIQVYDLKCTWSVEGFLEEYYLYRRAYIQALLYYKAAIHFMNNTEELRGYRVEPPKFIVCDSINYYAPLVYTLSDKDLENAYNGFTYKNREYKGVEKLIIELKWALENNTWNISMDNKLNGGEVKIM